MKIQTHMFCGQKYVISFHEDLYGSCDVTPTDMGRWEFFIFSKRENNLRYLDTIIHEALHACGLGDEKKVTQMAKDIARFLWRIGYRLKNQTEIME